MGPGSTVWVLDNTQECEIQLRHSRFASETVVGLCMNGAVEGRSIKTEANFYTSQLNVLVSATVNGKVIRCEYDDGTSPTIIGTSTLTLSAQHGELNGLSLYTMHGLCPLLYSMHVKSEYDMSTLYLYILLFFCIESFPPPDINGANVSTNELIFSWNPVSLQCPALDHSAIVRNCGTCVTNTSSARTVCNDFTVSRSDNICDFSIQSVICGSVPGNMTSLILNLKGLLHISPCMH